MAQDDYYYEIQLTNKQLVFYFMAGATGLILSFLAGVMVGRGVDAATGAEVQAAKLVREERIVPEEVKPAAPSPEELTYAQRLETDKPDDSLDRGKAAPKEPAAKGTGAKEAKPTGKEPGREAAAKPPKGKPGPDKPAPASPAEAKTGAVASAAPATMPPQAAPSAAPATTPGKPAVEPASSPSKPPHAAPGTFTIQVGAFKDKSSAESVVARLKDKGFAAYVFSPEGAEGGLFNVRVGSFAAKGDAERIQAKLRDDEKFKPFIVRN